MGYYYTPCARDHWLYPPRGSFDTAQEAVQGGWGGWPTGNGKKLSYSQACCLAQLCLAAA